MSALFASNAIVFASIVPHYPAFKVAFDLDDLAFGLLIAAGPVGSLVGSLIAGQLVGRFGAVRVALVSTFVLASMLVAVGWGSSLVVLIAAIFTIGFADATGDVANNSYALEVQRRLGRSIISGLHGVWSLGAIVGASVGFAVLFGGVPTRVHLTAVALVLVLLGASTVPFLRPLATVPDRWKNSRGARVTRSRLTLITGPLPAIAAVAAAGAFLEDLGSTWGGVLLLREGSVGEGLAGSAFLTSMVALTIGRLAGDRAVDRWGAAATLRGGGVVALVGLLLLSLVTNPVAVLSGFALVGIGIATAIPLAMDAANSLDGLTPGMGLSIAATVMRVGFLSSPLLVGAVSDTSTLRVALLVAAIGTVPLLVASRRRFEQLR